MTSIVHIYDRKGAEIDELNVLASRAWTLNDIGKAEFTMSIHDPKFSYDTLQFGNFIVIEHDQLPSWGGFLDTPRQWKNGVVTINAVSAEAILKYILGPQSDKEIDGLPGDLFWGLISHANNADDKHLVPGRIFPGGEATSYRLSGVDLWSALKEFQKDTGLNFMFVPEINQDNRLYFRCDLFQSGELNPNFIITNRIVEAGSQTTLTEQGEIFNSVIVSQVSDVNNKEYLEPVEDATSIGMYGYRIRRASASSIKKKSKIVTAAQAELKKYKQPRKTFVLNIIDRDGAFANIRLSNQYPVELPDIGFTGGQLGTQTTIRVVGMSYKDTEGKITLVLDEVFE